MLCVSRLFLSCHLLLILQLMAMIGELYGSVENLKSYVEKISESVEKGLDSQTTTVSVLDSIGTQTKCQQVRLSEF